MAEELIVVQPDPEPMGLTTQHVEKSFDYPTPRWEGAQTTASTTMYETAFTTHGPLTWGRWYICPVCLKEIPEKKVVWVDGKPYCRKDGKDVIHDKMTRGG